VSQQHVVIVVKRKGEVGKTSDGAVRENLGRRTRFSPR